MNLKFILIIVAIAGLAQMAGTQAIVLVYTGLDQPIPWQANEAAKILAMFLALGMLLSPKENIE